MARKAIYKHATLVDAVAYPDDPSAPIGTNEWNEDPDNEGMLGFNIETIASATTITPSNSMISITGSTPVATIATTNTSVGDILFVTTTDSAVLQHNTGNIHLQGEANLTLSTNSPILLVRKNTDWYQFGGLSVVSPKATGTANFQNMVLSGDLTVNGASTIINSTTISVDDKNITLADTANPTDVLADGGGITLKGDTDKTILYNNSNTSFDVSENVDLASGKKFKINNTDIFNPIVLEKQGSAPANPVADRGLVYVKQLDANNDGIFIKIKKNGTYNEVQIA